MSAGTASALWDNGDLKKKNENIIDIMQVLAPLWRRYSHGLGVVCHGLGVCDRHEVCRLHVWLPDARHRLRCCIGRFCMLVRLGDVPAYEFQDVA